MAGQVDVPRKQGGADPQASRRLRLCLCRCLPATTHKGRSFAGWVSVLRVSPARVWSVNAPRGFYLPLWYPITRTAWASALSHSALHGPENLMKRAPLCLPNSSQPWGAPESLVSRRKPFPEGLTWGDTWLEDPDADGVARFWSRAPLSQLVASLSVASARRRCPLLSRTGSAPSGPFSSTSICSPAPALPSGLLAKAVTAGRISSALPQPQAELLLSL